MKNLLIILFSSLILTNCTIYRADFTMGMTDVESPPSVSKNIDAFTFEDENIKIRWDFDYTRVDFVLENKTDKSIKVIWDEAIYVDEYGQSANIMHKGIKYIDRNDSQKPSTVARSSKLNDSITPTSKIYYQNPTQYTQGGWREKPLFHNKIAFNKQTVKDSCSNTVGLEVKILLPVEIDGIIQEYIFTFKVEDIHIIQC